MALISVNSRGVGFVSIEGMEDDARIEPENMNTALHGDEVEFLYKKEGKEIRGKVVRVMKRARTSFVGTIEKRDGAFLLIPDDKRMYAPFALGDVEESDVGKKAFVEMQVWENPAKKPKATIVRVLGEKGNNDVEMESIVLEKGMEIDFPKDVSAEAERIGTGEAAISAAEIVARRDFRSTPTFTIDPADAKDFDDALSFETLSGTSWRVGVHIADVSHYVRPGSALDREALKRGCSIYLVDRTIPMLPNILSDNLCSLNPHEEKLTFSAVFDITETNKEHFAVTTRWFGKTVIKSAKRFTYEEAQDVLDGKIDTHRAPLATLNRIAKFLREEKIKRGAIDFEQDEVRFVLDETGKPISVYKKERLDAHKLVEEWMLLANREVAELVFRGRPNDKKQPFLYRIHDLPDRERVTELALFVKALGHEVILPKKGGKVGSKDITALLEKIAGRAEEGLVKTAALRTMAKAVYSTKNIGHFGLAFPFYTHFTSPIRRYPDLLVHRGLQAFLKQKKLPDHELALLEKSASHSTQREIAAAEAERESIKMKQVEFMEQKIGESFDGKISGVTEWGIYVQEKNTRAEGMIRLRDLGDDFYMLDQKRYRVVGQKTKKTFALGDAVRFRITAADVERKSLDFKLV